MNGFLSLCELVLSWSEEVFALAFAAGAFAAPLMVPLQLLQPYRHRNYTAQQLFPLRAWVNLRRCRRQRLEQLGFEASRRSAIMAARRRFLHRHPSVGDVAGRFGEDTQLATNH